MNKKLLKITLVAVFSALSFVSLLIKIPISSPVGEQMIHLGNAITILVAILYGGLIGGLSGAIGMTIYDLLDPVYITSAPKTFILKFGIGIVAGLVFMFLKKKERPKAKFILLVFSLIALTLGIVNLTLSIKFHGLILFNQTEIENTVNRIDMEEYKEGKYYFTIDDLSIMVTKTDTLKTNNKDILVDGTSIYWINDSVSKVVMSKTAFRIHWAIYVFPLILGIMLFVTFMLVKKFPYISICAVIASSVAVLFNIFGEFVGKFIMQMILGQGPKASIINAYISLPATIINACICVFVVAILFPNLYNALAKDCKEESM